MMAQAEPAFQVEMQRMMEQPEMRKVVEASRSFVELDPTNLLDAETLL